MNAILQIKSRKRVEEHGEVFTAGREVNQMLSLVSEEAERINSRFLEPACGNGNFLIEILRRKLAVVSEKYRVEQSAYERNAFIAVSSLYGIDILEDNTTECRQRLYQLFYDEYYKLYKRKCDEKYLNAIKFVLNKNIVCGDALTLKTNTDSPIIFSEWSMVSEIYIQRRDFEFGEIIDGYNSQSSLSCFTQGAKYDKDKKCFIPAPVANYPLMQITEIVKDEQTSKKNGEL